MPPEFVDIATHFDDVATLDGYTGTFLFNAQFNTFDESAPDGSVVKRRTMSVRPGTVMPARKVLTISNETWIVGDGNTDAFQGQSIRSAYWMKKSSGLARLLTPGQVISNAPGITLHIHREYMKDTINLISDSEYDPFWDISLSPAEPAERGSFFLYGDSLLRVRATHADLNGLRVASCDELDPGSLVTFEFQAGTIYNPLTEVSMGTPVQATGIFLDMYKLYRYKTQADPKNHAGDMTLLVGLESDLKVGQHLTIDGDRWGVQSKEREFDAWNLQVRRQ